MDTLPAGGSDFVLFREAAESFVVCTARVHRIYRLFVSLLDNGSTDRGEMAAAILAFGFAGGSPGYIGALLAGGAFGVVGGLALAYKLNFRRNPVSPHAER
jgi:hypothetical protein